MKSIYAKIRRRMQNRSKQDVLIDFISDKKNIHRAAEGSMQKRIDLIHKADMHKGSV
jgi:hypothetical protein